MQSWIDFVNNIENSNIVVIGNKKDLKNEAQVTYEEGKKFCDDNNLQFFEVSAKDGTNINNMLFNSVASLPFFININNEGYTKDQIAEALMKENLDSLRYENDKGSSDNVIKGLNVIESNNAGEVSLKENFGKLGNNEDNQVIKKPKKGCC